MRHRAGDGGDRDRRWPSRWPSRSGTPRTRPGRPAGAWRWPRCCSRAWSAGRASRGVLAAGSALQLLVIAAGVVVPVMYALGVIFAGFWVLAIVMGRRAESSAPPAAPGRPGAGPR